MHYRTVWQKANGPIPRDSLGRSYEIHHINGNHSDNRLENLALVTIEEHYRIHYEQGDYDACNLISMRMGLSPEEVSKNSSNLMKLLSKENRHPFQGKNFNVERLANGTHNFLGSSNPSHKRVAEGTHNFQNKEWRSRKSKENQKRWLLEGTHPNLIRVSCICCKHETNNANLTKHIKRYHNEKQT